MAHLRCGVVHRSVGLHGALFISLLLGAEAQAQGPCVVPDNTAGTVDLPPTGCGYVAATDLPMKLDGAPPGTQLNLTPEHSGFFNISVTPSGDLGGEVEFFSSTLELAVEGTGLLAGFNRTLSVPTSCEVHTGPRTAGDPVQSFASEIVSLQGLVVADPDFAVLVVTAGSVFGLPSPGETTLRRLGPPGGDFVVDSFFDIAFEINFTGSPGGALNGFSGTAVGTVRLEAQGRPLAGPLNDECASRLAVTEGDTPIDNQGATDSGPNPPGCVQGGSLGSDVWYSFTPLQTAAYTFSTCGIGGFDTVLQLWSGTCSSLNLLECNDDSPGCADFTSELPPTSLNAGTPYLVQVGGFNGAQGQGLLNISKDDSGTSYCTSSGATIGFSGSTSIGNDDFVLEASGLPTDIYLFMVALNSARPAFPFPLGGTQCVFQPCRLNPPLFAASNSVSRPVPLAEYAAHGCPTPMVGSQRYYQCFFRSGTGTDTTNGLAVTFSP